MALQTLQQISISKLFVGKNNVRRAVGDITELTMSIEEKGVLEPLIVRPVGSHFEVIVGSRRLAASKAAGLKQVPVIVRKMTDDESLIASLTENIQRNNLEPIDLGRFW